MRFGSLGLLCCLAAFGAGAQSRERLGDSTGEFTVRGALRSSLGNDVLGGATRWDLRNEVVGGVAWGDGVLDVEVPILFRSIEAESLVGPGDITARGSVELMRRQSPESSDTLRLLPTVSIAPGASQRTYQWSLSSQAFTPQLGVGYRHSDQQWAVSASAFAAIPVALAGASFVAGPVAGLGAAVEYAPWRWLTGRLAVDFKQQWAAREGDRALDDTQSTALFAGFEARVSPVKQVAIAAALSQPIFTVSPGAYSYGRVYRLGVELAL